MQIDTAHGDDRHSPTRLTGGLNNEVFAEGGVCRKRYRLDDRPRLDREWRALTLLAQQAPGLAPRPIERRDGEILMELLPGRHLLSLPVIDRPVLAVLAEAYARMFSVDADGHPYEAVATLSFVRGRLESWTDPPPPLRVLLPAWLTSHDPALLAQPAPRVFARSDPNLANCLFHQGRVTMVDWEYAGLGDAAIELADVVEAQPSRTVPDHDWAWFLRQFSVDPPRFAAARRLAALHWTYLLHRNRSPALPEQIARCERLLSHRG